MHGDHLVIALFCELSLRQFWELFMKHPDFHFRITDNVCLHVDFARKEAVILFETHDGKFVQLQASHHTITKIHDEIRKQMEIS